MTIMESANKVVVTLRVTEVQTHLAERDGYYEDCKESGRHAPRDEFERETTRSAG